MENQNYKLSDFRDEIINATEVEAQEDHVYQIHAFYDQIEDDLADTNDIIELHQNYYAPDDDPSHHWKSQCIHFGNVNEETGAISLGYSDYNAYELETLTKTNIDSICNKMLGFVSNTINGYFTKTSNESNSIFSFARSIIDNIQQTSVINLYIFSTNSLSDRIKNIDREDYTINGVTYKVATRIYDIKALYQLRLNMMPKEKINIDVLHYQKQGLPSIKADLKTSKYQAYLAIVPGQFLSDIYKDYNGQLLEKNVRSFLSTRGNVNKGIKKTILLEPDKFFTYNNGIACTAESVETKEINGQLFITGLNDFQIINGGQTTASLRNAVITGKNIDLSQVFVSMKLTVINAETEKNEKDKLVQLISQYANTQNKVSQSDLNSNEAFYQRYKELSIKNSVPLLNNQTYQTRWFFERTRGEYERDQMELTKSQKEQFKRLNPHRIKKTDLAKYINTFELRPYDVVWGAEVNSNRFLKTINDAWEKNPDKFNEFFYQKSIAYAIIFEEARKLISGTEWYKANTGILAEIVPYTLSELQYLVSKEKGKNINFTSIWKTQKISNAMHDEILNLSEFVFEILFTKKEKANIAEWCKLPRCWENLKKETYKLSQAFINELIDDETVKEQENLAKKAEHFNREVNVSSKIYRLGPDYWQRLTDKAVEMRLITISEEELLRKEIQTFYTGRLLTDKQIKKVWEIRQRLINDQIPVEEPTIDYGSEE